MFRITFQKPSTEWPQYNKLLYLQSVSTVLLLLLLRSTTFFNKISFFFFNDFLLVNCQPNWGFPEEWHSAYKWEFGALIHYVVLTRLQSSSAGVSLGPLRVLNNASYSLSRELIRSKLSNQHWRALKECRVQSDWRLFQKIFHLNMEISVLHLNWATTTKVTWGVNSKHVIEIH